MQMLGKTGPRDVFNHVKYTHILEGYLLSTEPERDVTFPTYYAFVFNLVDA